VRLFLIRHAAAAERAADLPDESRPLTAEGRERFRDVVKRLGRKGVRFDRLYHSPLLRAVETADLCSRLVSGETVVTPALAEPPGEALLRSLEGESVALVGHEPHLSELLALLVVGPGAPSRGFAFRKGGVAIVEGAPRPGGMTLLAFLPPRLPRD